MDRRPTIAGPTPLLNPTSTVTTLIPAIFAIGFLAIMLEHPLRVNKAAAALLTAALCWTAYALSGTAGPDIVSHALTEHMGDIASILFFLLGAMTIVELIDAHDGFDAILSLVRTRHRRRLLWIVGGITFFMSAVLDNLTTTIVMVSMIRRLMRDERDRMVYAGLVVIAANAGGAWSPIGDVTTTMLWIGGQVTTFGIMKSMFLPSIVCILVPLLILSVQLRGRQVVSPDAGGESRAFEVSVAHRNIMFAAGIAGLLFVPVFKTLTHLPPFMGMLFSLGVVWVISEILHDDRDAALDSGMHVLKVLRRIDTPSVLFFLGILMAVSALEATGLLRLAADWLGTVFSEIHVIVFLIGLLSAVVDNVPLVAAVMGMYDLGTHPPDDLVWTYLAFAAGTGGSCLIIGSAAGVAAMGMERINFFWYARRIGTLALAGYVGGTAVVFLPRLL